MFLCFFQKHFFSLFSYFDINLNILIFYINWNPDPEIFQLGPIALRWYGLTWGLAVLLGFFTTRYAFRRANLPEYGAVKLVEYIFWGGLIGARLGEVIFYDLPYFLQNPIEIPMIWQGGLSSHGGAIGTFIATYLFVRRYPIASYRQILDISALGAALVGGLVRIGNLFNSEIVGKTTNVPWAFIFKVHDDMPRHPSALYEAVLLFGIYGLLMSIYHFRREKIPEGFIAALFFVVTFGGRFIAEFWKEYNSISQPLNLLSILIGLVILFYTYKKQRQAA